MVWSSSAAGCGRQHDEPRRRIDDDDLFARYCAHVAGWFQPVFVVPRILEIVPVPTGVVETPVGLLRSTSRHIALSCVPRHHSQSWSAVCGSGWNPAKKEGEGPSSPLTDRDRRFVAALAATMGLQFARGTVRYRASQNDSRAARGGSDRRPALAPGFVPCPPLTATARQVRNRRSGSWRVPTGVDCRHRQHIARFGDCEDCA